MTANDCGKRYLCCSFSCRRRTIVSRILPVLMQIVIIYVVWLFCQTRAAKEGRLSLTGAGSGICSPGDYTHGKLLRLDSLMSGANVISHGNREQPNFLNVEIIVRDLQAGTLVLYPIGTPVTSGGSARPEKVKADDDYAGFDSDHQHKQLGDEGGMHLGARAVVHHAMDHGVESLFEHGKDDIKKGDQKSLDGSFQLKSANDAFNQVNQNKVGFGEELNKNKTNFNQNSAMAMGNAGSIQMPFGSVGLPSSGQNIGSPNNNFAFPAAKPGSPHFAENGNFGNQVVQFQPIQNNMQQQFVAGEQKQIQSQNQHQMQQQQEQHPPQVHQQNPNLQIQNQDQQQMQHQQEQQHQQIQQQNPNPGGFNNQIGNIPNAQTGDSQNAETGDSNVAVDEDGPLTSDGLDDRLASFKTELYGQSVGASVIDSSSGILIHSENRCQGDTPVDILFLIHAQPQSDERRSVIRNTFANNAVFPGFRIVHVFLVGKTKSSNFQTNLNNEHQQFGDIVQSDFTDNNENSTRKGIFGMKWAKTFCNNAKFIMKIDEDVFVDTDKLLRGLIPAAQKVVGRRAMLCFLTSDAPIPRSGPKALSRDLFPHSTTLKPHCKAFAVLMTKGAVSSLLHAARHAPYVPSEDIFLFGVLPFLSGNLEVYDVGNKRAFHDFGQEAVNCYKDHQNNCPLVATKAFSSRFTALWTMVSERMGVQHAGWEGEKSLWDIASFKGSF